MPLRKYASSHASRHPGFQSTTPIIALGGLNEDENAQALSPFDLKVAYNCARRGSTTGTRPGVIYGDTDYTDALATAPPVQGMAEYIRTSSGVPAGARDVVVVADGEVYIDDVQGALDKSATTISAGADNHWRFASFQDKIFAAGGANGDGFWYWDGTGAAPGVIGNIALGFDVKFVFSKWNMIFVGGMNGSTFDDNGMIARYCDYATDATDPLNWPSSNVIPGQLLGENVGVGSRGSEYMTGFASYTDNNGDYLVFLTNLRLVLFRVNVNLTSNADAFSPHDEVATGCVSQDAYVTLGLDTGDAVYLSRDGIHALSQSAAHGNKENTYLSWPIRNTFRSLNMTRSKLFSAAYWRTEGLILFSVSTGSNTSNDLILCLDIKNSESLTPENVRWYKWELNGITANRIVPMRGSDGKPYPYVGGTLGEVVRFDRLVYSDNVTGEISTIFQTRDEDYGTPSREKHIGDLYLSLQGLGSYTIAHQFMLDDSEVPGQISNIEVPSSGTLWGVGVWDLATWSNTNATRRHRIPGIGSSPTISHRFSHNGANQPFWVGFINQEVMVSGPSDDADANTVGA